MLLVHLQTNAPWPSNADAVQLAEVSQAIYYLYEDLLRMQILCDTLLLYSATYTFIILYYTIHVQHIFTCINNREYHRISNKCNYF